MGSSSSSWPRFVMRQLRQGSTDVDDSSLDGLTVELGSARSPTSSLFPVFLLVELLPQGSGLSVLIGLCCAELAFNHAEMDVVVVDEVLIVVIFKRLVVMGTRAVCNVPNGLKARRASE